MVDRVFENKHLIIPLADVQRVEKHYGHKGEFNGFVVVTRHTRWDLEGDTWSNNIFVNRDEAEDFKRAWMLYLSEREPRKLISVDTTDLDPHLDPYQAAAVLKDLMERVRNGADIASAAEALGLKVTITPLGVGVT